MKSVLTQTSVVLSQNDLRGHEQLQKQAHLSSPVLLWLGRYRRLIGPLPTPT